MCIGIPSRSFLRIFYYTISEITQNVLIHNNNYDYTLTLFCSLPYVYVPFYLVINNTHLYPL